MPRPYFEVEVGNELMRIEMSEDQITGEVATSSISERVSNILPEVEKSFILLHNILYAGVAKLPTKPTEVTLELGMKIESGVGLIIANSTVSGQIKLSMTWKDKK